MSMHDELSKRMKNYYEKIPQIKLMRRSPVIIRVDGRSFHTFTRGFKRPFDDVLINAMQQTMKYMCENIQGCVMGYHQSDEISFVITDYKKLNSAGWFDYKVQKICSIAASMATMAFNNNFMAYYLQYLHNDDIDWEVQENLDLVKTYSNAAKKGAMFDARCFNIPKEEVANYIYWRQIDASRNSVQMVGQANFSHKDLHKKTSSSIQDMLMTQKGINWNNFPVHQKRGSCCIKEKYFVPCESGNQVVLSPGCSDPCEDEEAKNGTWRTRWTVDMNIPIFKGENRDYIDKLIKGDTNETI